MMQEFVLLLLFLGIMVYRLSHVLWQEIKPSNSFSGAGDYARLVVASWTSRILTPHHTTA